MRAEPVLPGGQPKLHKPQLAENREAFPYSLYRYPHPESSIRRFARASAAAGLKVPGNAEGVGRAEGLGWRDCGVSFSEGEADVESGRDSEEEIESTLSDGEIGINFDEGEALKRCSDRSALAGGSGSTATAGNRTAAPVPSSDFSPLADDNTEVEKQSGLWRYVRDIALFSEKAIANLSNPYNCLPPGMAMCRSADVVWLAQRLILQPWSGEEEGEEESSCEESGGGEEGQNFILNGISHRRSRRRATRG